MDSYVRAFHLIDIIERSLEDPPSENTPELRFQVFDKSEVTRLGYVDNGRGGFHSTFLDEAIKPFLPEILRSMRALAIEGETEKCLAESARISARLAQLEAMEGKGAK